MPDDPKAQEATEQRDETVKQHEKKRARGEESSIEDQSVKPFYYGKPQYKSDDDRRRELAAEQGEEEKYIVTDANPATGGVYPPSAVVTPYDPEVVAAHTPGEQVEEPEETDPKTAQLKGRQHQPDTVDPQTPASLHREEQPAASTTPAT